MGSRLSWICAAVLSVALTACGESLDTARVINSDSAGIEIVSNNRTFVEVPIRAIRDELESEIVDEDFFGVTAIQPLADGRLAVGVSGSRSVLIYDAAGERVSELGREGDGPGEFRGVRSLVQLPGDSLGVYDSQLRRLTVFPPFGGAPRVLSLSGLAPGRGESTVLPLRTGLAFVGEGGLGGARESGVYRNSEESYHVDLDGQVISTYGEFPGLEAFVGDGMMGRAPFGALLATATQGEYLIVGTGDRPELRMYGPEGGLNRIVRWEDQDRTVTPERMSQFVDFLVSQGPPDQANAMRKQVAGMPFAPRAPAHAQVIVSPEGVLWVGEYPGPEMEMPAGRKLAARRWVVFGPDGRMLERIETPPGFIPMSLTEGLVWGVYFNELDVESVRAYRTGS